MAAKSSPLNLDIVIVVILPIFVTFIFSRNNMKHTIFLTLFLLTNLIGFSQQTSEPLFTIEKDSIICNNKQVEPFFWVHQNDTCILEKTCSIASQNKKYNYTIILSDYNTARGDGGCFRIIDIEIGNKTILQLNQSDGWDKIPPGIRDLSFQDYFLVEPLSDTVTAIIFCGYPYNSEPELLTIVILNKETAKLVFNKNFIISEIKKTNNEFCLKLQDTVIEYTNDRPVKKTGVYRLWKENGILKFGGPYETVDRNVWAGEK